MKKTKKTIASLLAVLMLVSLLPVSAFADDPEQGEEIHVIEAQVKDVGGTVYVNEGNSTYTENEEMTESKKVDSDIVPTEPTENSDPALYADAETEDVTLEVTGSAVMDNVEETDNVAIYVYAEEGNVDLDVGGAAVAQTSTDTDSTWSVNATAVIVDAYGDTDVSVGGGATAIAEYTGEETMVDTTATVVNAYADYGGSLKLDIKETAYASANSTSENGRADATAVSIEAWSGENIITVGGSAVANAKNSSGGPATATAVYVRADGSESEEDVNVDVVVAGSAITNLNSSEDLEMSGSQAVLVEAADGATAYVEIQKAAIALSNEEYNVPVAVRSSAWGEDSESLVSIGTGALGQVAVDSSDGATSELYVRKGGIIGQAGPSGLVNVTSTSESASIVNTVGDIIAFTAEGLPYMTVAVNAAASDGGWTVMSVNGGVYVENNTESEKTMLAGMIAENDGGTIKSFVNGDMVVTGGAVNAGVVLATDGEEGTKTDIIINGTIDAEDMGIVLISPTQTIMDNVTMTVWAITQNEDGAVAVVSEGENAEDMNFVECEDFEKAIQYIVRINAEQTDIISTNGTTEYQSFNVANEGDVVTLKLNIPEGYKVVEAYSDVAKETRLEKDADGNYYLTMPRGGAVELSVKLVAEENSNNGNQSNGGKKEESKNNQNSTNNAKEEKKDDGVKALLTIKDKSGKISIKFMSDGRFEAKMEDGSIEKGTFKFVDGKLVLKLGTNEIKADEENKFTYVSLNNPALTYDFEMKANEIAALKV